ncbi:MAG: hypothetical protein ACN0LA_01140 [Candidatus Longimicrobiales bacterium M2_2A_002]
MLRELPSVLGAYVSEDLEGNPREIHLLVRHGPDTAGLARDIRSLLEERLGIPIDQRVISIAQLAPASDVEEVPAGAAEEVATTNAGHAEEVAAAPSPTKRAAPTPEDEAALDGGRPVFAGLEARTSAGHVVVTVRLEWRGRESTGEADAVDTPVGRARAAAGATLKSAANAEWNRDLSLELDFASVVQALDGEYILVSVLGMSSRLGRRPLPLVSAHPIESDVETAAALGALKAINRILSVELRPAG